MFDSAPGVLISDDISKENTPIREETEINNNESEGEVNVEESTTMTREKIKKITTIAMKLRLMTKKRNVHY